MAVMRPTLESLSSSVVETVDKALYEAKQAGRNRVVMTVAEGC